MLAFLRHATRHAAIALLAGLLLRLWFIHYCPLVDGDTLVYGELARNWFWHGIYGFTRADGIHASLIRLPGYPLFLGICFFVFGIDHYTPILFLQAVLDLFSCLLLAGFAFRCISRRAAVATLYLAALCPFTANYVATPLTETLTLLCISLGLYALARYVERPGFNLWFGMLAGSIGYAALLRPDGPLLGVVLVPAMFWYARKRISNRRSLNLAACCTLLTLLPFIAWTARNARTFHLFQPLAPRYANNPDEFVPRGWIRWVQSWAVDYASTAEIYWNVNGAPLDITVLSARAFDSPAQRAETAQLFSRYNKSKVMNPVLDAAFAQLARQRVADHPFRFYVELPLARLADMWLRPRTELTELDDHWWDYESHPAETIFGWSYAALDVAYILLALWGVRQRVPFTAVMLAYIAFRCMLLLTLETPESRYTLECFPIIFILAGAALAGRSRNAAATFPPPASLNPS